MQLGRLHTKEAQHCQMLPRDYLPFHLFPHRRDDEIQQSFPWHHNKITYSTPELYLGSFNERSWLRP